MQTLRMLLTLTCISISLFSRAGDMSRAPRSALLSGSHCAMIFLQDSNEARERLSQDKERYLYQVCITVVERMREGMGLKGNSIPLLNTASGSGTLVRTLPRVHPTPLSEAVYQSKHREDILAFWFK